MTHVITVRNINQALSAGFWWLKTAGEDEHSRNGTVRVAPGPVVTEYRNPKERVLFNSVRDANPVFHLLESIWMIAGRDENKFLLPYNARMESYSEPDGTIHGAYGHRWRSAFGIDQVKMIIDELRHTPTSRQCVLQMWDSRRDLGVEKKDRPCNTHVYFRISKGRLDMTVCCRSNDALWGAYGANVVHFSILQELVASAVGIQVGTYRQFSNNFHAYWDIPVARKFLENPPSDDDSIGYPPTVQLLSSGETLEDFTADCAAIVRGDTCYQWNTEFFKSVASPLKVCYDGRRVKSRTWRLDLARVAECDWKVAFIEWTKRRDDVS